MQGDLDASKHDTVDETAFAKENVARPTWGVRTAAVVDIRKNNSLMPDMKFLAISGSLRANSTNTALLRALQTAAGPEHVIAISDHISRLPIFSPDLEVPAPPAPVDDFVSAIREADGILIASPEYVRSIPGGLKNAIDWLVSSEALVNKPIALAHASHRGDDMLDQLRIVLGTVSNHFKSDVFLRFHLMKLSPEAVTKTLAQNDHTAEMHCFLDKFADFCQSTR
jgi:chromate reductase, NAD(P)H dehydrogenase (quinone)